MTEEERDSLIRQCIATAGPKFVRGWFYYKTEKVGYKNTDAAGDRIYPPMEHIKRGNVEEWLSWALFGRQCVADLEAEESKQMRSISSLIEMQFKLHIHKGFEEGYNDEITVVRLDGPVSAYWKPLLLFFIFQFVWVVSACLFYVQGFRYEKHGDIKYWIRKSQNSRCPIVFTHGIGFGLTPYFFCHTLVKQTDRTWILVELPDRPHIRHLGSYAIPEDFAQNLRSLIRSQGYEDAHLIGHSIGTVYLTWILRFQPGLARSFVMVDPISLLLHRSEVLWNFLYKMRYASPEGIRQKVLDFVLKNDLNVSYRLRRCFFWHKNILWIEDLPDNLPHMFFIGGQDEYIPAEDVKHYIERHGKASVVYEPEAKHGNFVMKTKYRELVINTVATFLSTMS